MSEVKNGRYELTDKIEWYRNGLLHREDGPAVEYFSGTKFWYLDEVLHRESGPAIEYENGTKHWYIYGKHHREDGPAIEFEDGGKHWYLNGEPLAEEEFTKYLLNKKLQTTLQPKLTQKRSKI